VGVAEWRHCVSRSQRFRAMGTKEWEEGRQRRQSGPKAPAVNRFNFSKTVELLRAEIKAHMTRTPALVKDLQREHRVRLKAGSKKEARVQAINEEEDALMEALALRIKLMRVEVAEEFGRAESGVLGEIAVLSPRGAEKHIPRLIETMEKKNEVLDRTFELERDQVKADLRAEIDFRNRTRKKRLEEAILDNLHD